MSTAPRDSGPPQCLWDPLSSLPHKGFWGSAVVFSLCPLFRRADSNHSVTQLTDLSSASSVLFLGLPHIFIFGDCFIFPGCKISICPLPLVTLPAFFTCSNHGHNCSWNFFIMAALKPLPDSPNIANVLVLAPAKRLFSFNFCFPKFLVIWMIFR